MFLTFMLPCDSLRRLPQTSRAMGAGGGVWIFETPARLPLITAVARRDDKHRDINDTTLARIIWQ